MTTFKASETTLFWAGALALPMLAAAAPVPTPAPVPHPAPVVVAHPAPTAVPNAAPAVRNVPQPKAAYSVPPAAVSSRGANGDAALNSAGSSSVLRQLNANRASMGARNQQPIPAGDVISHANGSVTVQASGDRQYELSADGHLASFSSQGRKAEFRSDGQIGALHTANMDVVHGIHGERTVTVRGPNNTLIVSTGAHSGYVQKQILIQGRPYQQRTFVQNGIVQTRLYAMAPYHDVDMPHYVPQTSFAPAFYNWAFFPWPEPVRYAWGWQAEPWYGEYATYYLASPAYATPSVWLTDFTMSQTMASGYQAEMNAKQAPGYAELDPSTLNRDTNSSDVYAQVATPITPFLKMQLNRQVWQQISVENGIAQNPQALASADSPDRVLVPNRLFVVDQSLYVTTTSQQNCSLSAGSVLRLMAAPDQSASSATLLVAASRQSECPAGQQVVVSLLNLQEMQNSFRAQLNAGLMALHSGQGQSGLPNAPKSAIEAPPRPIEHMPDADAAALAQLDNVQQQANNEETQVKAAAFQEHGG